jgi:dephospho-CoA kinase
MLVLGLTGSIAMGKSHAARIFGAFGVPVFDADAEVHALMAPGGDAVDAIVRDFPDVQGPGGGVDRKALGRAVFGDAEALRRLERVLHPRVRAREQRFLALACRQQRKLVVLDVPLLLETGGERRCDRVVVVSAAAFLQRQRALARPGMTSERLAAVRGQQMSEALKRRRADFVIHSGLDRGQTVRQIGAILVSLDGLEGRAWPHGWRTTGNEGR